MNPPSYEFLSAPPALITLLHLLTLTLHLAAMSVLFGGLGALLLARVSGKYESLAGRRFVSVAPVLMAATVTLGVAPLLFLQLVYHRQVYAAAIASGWFWLAVPALVIAAYFLLYARALRSEAATPARGTSPGGLAVAFVLLALVALVYSAVFTLAETPGVLSTAWSADPSGLVLDPQLGRWLPRWLHMVAGALAIGSFALAAFARDDTRLFAAARASFLWSTIAAVLLGVATLVGLGDGLAAYMRSAAVWWMLGALLAALGALHFLFRRRFVLAGALLAVSLFGMVVNRHLARRVALADVLDPAQLPIRPQWEVFALFLVCFVAMLAVVAWMLRLYFAAPRPAAGRPD